jgi:hypothetical protein
MPKNPNITQLDPMQALRRTFDEENDRLRVDSSVTVTLGNAEVVIDHVDDSIRLGNGTDLVTTTTSGSDVGLDVNVIGGTVTGELTLSGLRIAGRNTTMNVLDVATVIPAIPLASRNTITVTNMSGTDTLYIGFDTGVTADSVIGITSGFPVGPQQGFNLDVTDEVELYGIAEAGKTIKIIVTELA